MERILYNAAMYISELVKLCVAVSLLFCIKLKSRMHTMVCITLFILTISLISSFCDPYNLGPFFDAMVILCVILCLKNKRQTGMVILIYIFICLLDMVVGIFAATIGAMSKIPNKFSISELGLNCVSGFLIAILSFIRMKILKKAVHIDFSTKQIILIIIGGCSIGVYLSSIMLFMMDQNYSLYKSIAALALSMSSIIFIVICFLLISSHNKNKYLKKETEVTQNLLKAQKKYYISLLKKDEETKQFRHDIKNHLYCMKMLCENMELEQLGDYFDKMNIELNKLTSNIHTGSNLIDVIIDDILGRYPSVEFKWEGHIENDLRLSQMDLCTLFSNLISNAFEAAEFCNDKRVNICVKFLESTLFINVENTYFKEPIIKDNEFISIKSGEGHGYGMQNIKECLIKYNGHMDNDYCNGIFITDIVIPNAI